MSTKVCSKGWGDEPILNVWLPGAERHVTSLEDNASSSDTYNGITMDPLIDWMLHFPKDTLVCRAW